MTKQEEEEIDKQLKIDLLSCILNSIDKKLDLLTYDQHQIVMDKDYGAENNYGRYTHKSKALMSQLQILNEKIKKLKTKRNRMRKALNHL